MRIGFTDQRLTAHGGLAVWTRFIPERGLRAQLRAVLPHAPTSPNAYDPCDPALGFIGGMLCGADQLARVAQVWRRYNGRADIENRIKELGSQFGLKGLCCRSFWATEAACHLAICAYNLCVGLQRRLGQPHRAQLTTRGGCFRAPRSAATRPANPRSNSPSSLLNVALGGMFSYDK